MKTYSKTRKLTLPYVRQQKIHVVSKSPLVVSIDGDQYNIAQISGAFTRPAQDYIINETRRIDND